MGGGAPVTIQSMTNTPTSDVEATVAQIRRLAAAGCQIVRVAVPDMAAAKAVGAIKEQIDLPLVVDIHFDYRLALECIEAGADKVRINPGNIGGEDRVKAVAMACARKHIPIRIGVNGGSLEKPLLAKYGGVTPQALVDSAFGHIALLNRYDFDDICVSLKSSSVPIAMQAYQLMHEQSHYPLHLGVTEAGTTHMGTLKSAAGIGGLLALGIGDTLRVTLTADPVEEIYAARDILKAIGLRKEGPDLVACPWADEDRPHPPGPGGGGAPENRDKAHHRGRHGLPCERPRRGIRRRRGHCRGEREGLAFPPREGHQAGAPGGLAG